MPIPAKLGSLNTGAGVAMMGDTSVIINGRPASRIGDYVTGHPGFDPRHPHPPNPIIQGSISCLIGGRPLGFLGSFDACRHNMLPTESDVQVGSF
jgi:hypothetical protein